MRPIGSEIVVATYNIHGGVGTDGRHDLPRIIRVIGELGADIVGLQEVAGAPDADTFALLARECGYFAVAGPNITRERCPFGNLLLSRWPLDEYRLLDISVSPFEPRGAIDALPALDQGRLRVIVTHLGLRRSERRQQLSQLREALEDDPVPVVILGDFNAPTRRELVKAGLGGHPRFRLAPRSFPSNVPLVALDRVWARPDSLLRKTRAHRSELSRVASDHLPIIASLSIPP
jgi:endonuclease/exonuclease/phosphatase family metal-dependent hydrolase